MNHTDFPKISIITPSFNQGQFLEETIRSVLDQRYPNLEYIIIDGGSTDGSADIIRSYETYLSYWVSEKDSGQSEAINKGFSRCSGDIVAWINSDDLYAPGTFAFVSEFFQNNEYIDMIYGDVDYIDAHGQFIMRRKDIPFDRTMCRLVGFGSIAQPSVFFRRKVIHEVGLLNETLHYAMDADYWARISEKHSIRHLPKVLAKTRFHGSTKTLQRMRGTIDCGHQEDLINLENSYNKLAICRLVPFSYSKPIRLLYKMIRALKRSVSGYYAHSYKPFRYFKKHDFDRKPGEL